MATLTVSVIFGLIIAYFATQNTEPITLYFLNYGIPNIPTYIALVGALLVGLVLSWAINLINNVVTGFTIRSKESKIKEFGIENTELTKQNHKLELENTRLEAETGGPADDKSL